MIHSRFKLFPTAIAAALAVASCTNEEAQVIPPTGNQIQFTTRVSRATETTLDVLKGSEEGFKVYADVDDWDNLLINGDVAKWNDAQSAFVLDKKYNWTSDMKNIRFWAFHPITNVSPAISANNIQIRDFTPVASLENPGKTQSDLIIAYNSVQFGAAPGNAVPLTFQHALSQISVNVNNAEVSTDGRKVVKIAGACIVNVKNRGSLIFHANDDDATAAADNRFTINDANGKYDIEWSLSGATNASYGLAFNGDNLINLIPGIIQAAISNGNSETNSSLMLVPQKTAKYSFDNPSAAGSYILLLCRVEIHHPGETHTGTREGAYKSVGSDGKGGHIHQLFPALQNNTYDETAYGYTCVPVDFDWKPGLRHIYTLNFLGANAGAGQYPPEDHPEIPTTGIEVVPTPDDKEPGDNVLDNPITFSVTVADWQNAADKPTPTPMP